MIPESNLFFILETRKGKFRLCAGYSIVIPEDKDEIVQITNTAGLYDDPVTAFEALQAITPEGGVIFQNPVKPSCPGMIWLSEISGANNSFH